MYYLTFFYPLQENSALIGVLQIVKYTYIPIW